MAAVIHTDGRQWPATGLSRIRSKWWARRRENTIRKVEIRHDGRIHTFLCENLRDYARCAGIFLKEPGTCEWIERTVGEGDVFYDVGANIGVYSILAGHRVGPSGRVVAFEPHAGNFAALTRNIEANGFSGRITPCSFALHGSSGFFDFNYSSLVVGTSSSQLDSIVAAEIGRFDPVISELKYAAALDDLVLSGRLPRPTHIKIDVDGNEEQILGGMAAILTGKDKPISLSIEVDGAREAQIERQLGSWGYRLSARNFTRAGERKRRAGGLEPGDGYNAIFVAVEKSG